MILNGDFPNLSSRIEFERAQEVQIIKSNDQPTTTMTNGKNRSNNDELNKLEAVFDDWLDMCVCERERGKSKLNLM